MNIQTLTEESRSHKLEFINLYCKHVAKFTKMFGLNRYKAHRFEMIMDCRHIARNIQPGGRAAISKVWSQSAENFAIFFGKDNLILGLFR